MYAAPSVRSAMLLFLVDPDMIAEWVYEWMW
jgi:hypothetical protein